jgi:hypothetical protein
MKSTPEFEQRLADAMVSTWKAPVRPNFSEAELVALEKVRAYKGYVDLITNIINDHCAPDKFPSLVTAAK